MSRSTSPVTLEAILPPDIIINNQRLILTRWFAGAALAAATFFAVQFMGLPLPATPLYVLSLVILAYNFLLHHASRNTRDNNIRRLITLQIVLDWISMTILVHFTGGITSPAPVFFFLHVVMVTILLPDQSPYVYVAAVVLMVLVSALLELAGLLQHADILPQLSPALATDPQYVILQLSFFAVALFATAGVTSSVMRPLRRRERQLSALVQTIHAVSASLEMREILEHLVANVQVAFNADGATIWLLELDRTTLTRTATSGIGAHCCETLSIRNAPIYNRVLNGGSILISGTSVKETFQEIPPGIQSVLLVPIRGEYPLGVLTVYSQTRIESSSYELRFARTIADEGAIAISHALAHSALQRAEQQRSQFVRIVTHELRAPVTGLQSLLRVLLANMAGELNDEQQDILQRLNRRMDSLLVLINDLLSLAASKARDLQQPLAPVNVAERLKKVVADSHYSAVDKQVSLTSQLPTTVFYVMATDEGIDRILDNLIGNAIKYTPAGGQVGVKLEHNTASALIQVNDNGMGIPEEALDKLGQEFFRANNAKDSGVVGTGLGLATVKQLIENFNGSMHVSSVVGEGTTFTVSLPLVNARTHSSL